MSKTNWPEIHRWLGDRNRRAADHAVITRLIKGGEPFALARLGTGEVRALRDNNAELCTRHLGIIPPSEHQLNVYRKLYVDSVVNCDAVGKWNARLWFPNESQAIRLMRKSCTVQEVFAETIGDVPYYLHESTRANSWFSALAGKKVLVVHSFAATMKKQYDSAVFTYPKFSSIHFYRASNTQSEPTDVFETSWTEELEKMEKGISELDFEIALIGCGAYSAPLADYVKTVLKKSSMVMGSSLQLYFGILGKRWEDHPDYAHLRAYWNDRWVRPSDEEKPKNYQKIEGGAYW